MPKTKSTSRQTSDCGLRANRKEETGTFLTIGELRVTIGVGDGTGEVELKDGGEGSDHARDEAHHLVLQRREGSQRREWGRGLRNGWISTTIQGKEGKEIGGRAGEDTHADGVESSISDLVMHELS
jgi:hypothetical protein